MSETKLTKEQEQAAIADAVRLLEISDEARGAVGMPLAVQIRRVKEIARALLSLKGKLEEAEADLADEKETSSEPSRPVEAPGTTVAKLLDALNNLLRTSSRVDEWLGQLHCACPNFGDTIEVAQKVLMDAMAVPAPPADTPMDHTRSCPALTPNSDDQCTCGLEFRIQLQTEREMHNAWKKRAEEAELKLIQPPEPCPKCIEAHERAERAIEVSLRSRSPATAPDSPVIPESSMLFEVCRNAMQLLRETGFQRENPNHPIWQNWEKFKDAHAAPSAGEPK